MKKNFILITLVAVIAVVATLFSCQKDGTIFKQIPLSLNNIHKDKDFQSFIITLQNQVKQVKDINTIAIISKKSKLTDQDIEKLSLAYGYISKQEFLNDQEIFTNNLNKLDKKYNFKDKNSDSLLVAVYKTFDELHLFSKTNNTNGALVFMAGGGDPCETARVACLVSVAAQAVLMNLACGGLDLTIVLGIICHGAVITYQISASAGCNATAQTCSSTNTQ